MNIVVRKFLLLFVSLFFIVSCSVVDNKKAGKDEPLPPLSEKELDILKKMGGELDASNNIRLGDITIHRREKELSFPGYLNMTDGELEVLISMSNGRIHESLLVSDVDPLKLQVALFLLGAENGARTSGGELIPQGTILNMDVEPENGKKVPVESWLYNKKTSAEMERFGWVFVGSSFTHDMGCLAKNEGNIANIWSCGNTVLDNPTSIGNDDDFIKVYNGKVPPYKTPVRIYLSIRKK